MACGGIQILGVQTVDAVSGQAGMCWRAGLRRFENFTKRAQMFLGRNPGFPDE